MTKAEIADQIRRFIETEFPSDGSELSLDTNLLENWFVDSLGIIQTVLFVEGAFGLEMSRADINRTNFHSVATLTDFVATRLTTRG